LSLQSDIEDIKKQLAEGELESAKLSLNQLSELHKDSWSVWILLAGIASREKNLVDSVMAFRNLVSISKSSPFASSGLAHALFRSERLDEAMEEIDRFSIECDPDLEETNHVLEEHVKIKHAISELENR